MKAITGIWFIICSLIISQVWAQQPIGKLLFVKGQVWAAGAGEKARHLQQGAPIYVGERVWVSARGLAQLRMVDDALIMLQNGAKIW